MTNEKLMAKRERLIEYLTKGQSQAFINKLAELLDVEHELTTRENN